MEGGNAVSAEVPGKKYGAFEFPRSAWESAPFPLHLMRGDKPQPQAGARGCDHSFMSCFLLLVILLLPKCIPDGPFPAEHPKS